MLDERAKRPATRLAGPYGHPLHPILVTVPIGAWVCAFVFDLASWFVGDPAAFAQGSRWLIAIGLAGALAAAPFGFLDFVAIPPRTPAFRIGLAHMGINAGVVAIYAVDLAPRIAGPATRAVPVVLVALTAVGLACLAAAGTLGGRLAYRYGVRVVDEATQRKGFTTR